MTRDDPRKRRRDLERSLDAAYAAYSQATQRRQAAEIERAHAQRAITTATTARATGTAKQRDVDDAHARLGKAEGAVVDNLARANAALDAAHAVERQLEELFAAEFEVFV